ncbi:ubiquinol-cytochrome c reductase iron-sulfur subunit [Hydrocarboniclastica marina]|uniref:Ubiquinol-cytochrome c reductase iron-sulfur subunit n=1 Tax=Hydrocarboniclastica marina TaxID=2259620 RepID=A0A4P7XEY2_9ALTE|nr:ubiquinol-cytochrome c reductase iron-sulfur subunit [Hydrocarboniclastica marina]MAL99920.1 ubiquinol-cytochrome c reductase iron-sulfur subunit [Alteromonadaceae bacterium]QCF25123.1 ubiquinol-cytochrome c reductase iron-sulfur subunit [Hydrocarboniclastica marina]|tara:strand:- start:2573 stop:3157 length:585 start_codon:yes stop_codon:yes gene_type:complete
MNNGDVNQGRRRFLIGATSVVGGIGMVGVAVPFVASWQPSAKAEAAGAPVRVDVSKLEVGQQITVSWRGMPVWIVRRGEEMNNSIPKLSDTVHDFAENAPEYIEDEYRSLRREIGVYVGICTHLGCVPSYRPEVAPADLGDEWLGGFFCPCHGTKYDLAGRVYNNQPAPMNLEVPPNRYEGETTLVVGEDPEEA